MVPAAVLDAAPVDSLLILTYPGGVLFTYVKIARNGMGCEWRDMDGNELASSSLVAGYADTQAAVRVMQP